MGDVLQGLLDAEAARVGLLAGGPVGLHLRPVAEAAMGEAAHAGHLVLDDGALALRRHEDQRLVRRAQRLGEAGGRPGHGALAVGRGQPDQAPTRADAELRRVIQRKVVCLNHR